MGLGFGLKVLTFHIGLFSQGDVRVSCYNKSVMNVLLYGNESFLLSQELLKLLKLKCGDDYAMNTVYYDASIQPFSFQNALDDADTLPMFSDHKVVVVKHAQFLVKGSGLNAKESASFISFLQQDRPETTFVLMHDNDNIDTSKDYVKELKKNAELIHVKKLESFAYRKVVQDLIKQKGLQLSKAAFETLIFRLDENLANAYQEIEKLEIYGQKLNEEDIEALVSRPLDNEVFHLVNAIMDKNMKRAFSIWNDMVVLNMEPLAFVGLIASQLRLMYQVALLNKEGYHREDMINLLSVGTPNINVGRVNRMLALSRNTKPERILEILNHLASLDQKSKMGLLDKNFGFELFLIEAMI